MSEEKEKPERGKGLQALDKAVAGLSEGARDRNPASILPLLGLAASPIHRRMMRDPAMTEEATEALLGKLEKAMNRRSDETPFNWNPEKGPGFSTIYDRFKPVEEVIGMPPGFSASTMGHEMGHAFAPSKLEGALKRVSPFLRHPAAVAAPSLLALSGALSPKEELPITSKIAPWLGALQFAAILGEEARANIRGNQLLKAVGQNVGLKEQLKSFVPTLSYLPLAVPLIALPYAINKGLKAHEEAKKKGRDVRMQRSFFGKPSDIAALPSPEELKAKWQEKFKP